MMLALALLAATSLTDEMWSAAKPTYDATLAHPYLAGLADGTLPRESFRFYLEQDAKYLVSFSEALRIVAAKSPRAEWASTLRRHATEAIDAERAMHAAYGVSAASSSVRPARANRAYTWHLIRTARRGTFADGLAALLPCYWIYWEVGKELTRRGSKNPAYQRWIAEYGSESYGETVRAVLDMMNTEAARLDPAARRRAVSLFVQSARHEHAFWDMAWHRRK
jgi:thiaminase/transcriptional activator TenA